MTYERKPVWHYAFTFPISHRANGSDNEEHPITFLVILEGEIIKQKESIKELKTLVRLYKSGHIFFEGHEIQEGNITYHFTTRSQVIAENPDFDFQRLEIELLTEAQ